MKLAVIGSRRPTTYGIRMARMLAEDLAREGVVIVSGLARGIDAIAHESALKMKKLTIAVLGCGVDRAYPPEHAHLMNRISHQGAVISEFFPGEPPLRDHFPQRNRIIAGLCKGVLVVEAGDKSGTLITARLAGDQSREVFSVPGPIDSPQSIGTNRLISQGAKLVASTKDVLEELLPGSMDPILERRTEDDSGKISKDAKGLLQFLEMDEPHGVDELVHKGQLPVAIVLKSLGELEVLGIVERREDARYVRVVR